MFTLSTISIQFGRKLIKLQILTFTNDVRYRSRFGSLDIDTKHSRLLTVDLNQHDNSNNNTIEMKNLHPDAQQIDGGNINSNNINVSNIY